MKTVFENHMVAHVWNSQSQHEGRSNNGNFYFRDSTLFSYGSHFIVGKIMPDGVALLNASSYSISTSRHQSQARQAASNRTRLYVPGLTSLVEYDLTKTGVRAHLSRNPNMDESAAHYLLKISGEKNPPKVWTRIQADAARAAKEEKESEARDKLDSELRDASNVAAMDDGQVNEYLARACNRNEIKKVSTRLYHAHRAAKKRKRNVQASRVFEVLTLARKIIKLDEAREHAKARNRSFHSARFDLRSALKELSFTETNSAYKLSRVQQSAERLARYVPARLGNARAIYESLQCAAGIESNAAHEREDAERMAREIAQLEAWRNGDRSARVHYTYGPTMLRALDVTRDAQGVITGGTLQTSRNAEVPLTHAIRAFRFVKLCRDHGRSWTRNGHALRVGHFAIDHVAESGDFKAGCHNIQWAEVERVARALGVFDLSADDSALTPSNVAAE